MWWMRVTVANVAPQHNGPGRDRRSTYRQQSLLDHIYIILISIETRPS